MYHTVQSRASLMGLGEDVDVATLAGEVRYVKQLYQWNRQTLQWLHNLEAKGVDTSAAKAELLRVDDELYPPMSQIAEAETELRNRSGALPGDLGFRWAGWEGTATTPPALPPAATPISEAEANAGGLSGAGEWVCYAVGAVMIGVGLFLGWTGIGLLAVAAGLALIATATVVHTPAGQDAIRNIGKSVGDVLRNTTKPLGDALFWIAIGLAGLWAFSSGRFNTRSQRGGSAASGRSTVRRRRLRSIRT